MTRLFHKPCEEADNAEILNCSILLLHVHSLKILFYEDPKVRLAKPASLFICLQQNATSSQMYKINTLRFWAASFASSSECMVHQILAVLYVWLPFLHSPSPQLDKFLNRWDMAPGEEFSQIQPVRYTAATSSFRILGLTLKYLIHF